MGLGVVEWNSFWALMAVSALPWITSRTVVSRRTLARDGRLWVPPRWVLLVLFVAVWVLAHLALWFWNRDRVGRKGASFDAVNWLYYANVLLHSMWISEIHDRGRDYTVGTAMAVASMGTALAIAILQGDAAHSSGSNEAWVSFALWMPVLVWQSVLVVYSAGLVWGLVRHNDDGDMIKLDDADDNSLVADEETAVSVNSGLRIGRMRRGRE